MNKEALLKLTKRDLLTGAMAGAGFFGVGALRNEMKKQKDLARLRESQLMPSNQDTLLIEHPRPRKQESESVYGSGAYSAGTPYYQLTRTGSDNSGVKIASNTLQQTLGLLLGAPVGFIGAKTIHDKWNDRRMNKQVETENQKYLQLLSDIQKTSSAKPEPQTPHLDKLLKEAVAGALAAGAGALAAGAGLGAAGWQGGRMLKEMKDRYDKSEDSFAVSNLWKTIAGLTAAGGAGYLWLNDPKRREEAERSKSEHPPMDLPQQKPRSVRLQYV